MSSKHPNGKYWIAIREVQAVYNLATPLPLAAFVKSGLAETASEQRLVTAMQVEAALHIDSRNGSPAMAVGIQEGDSEVSDGEESIVASMARSTITDRTAPPHSSSSSTSTFNLQAIFNSAHQKALNPIDEIQTVDGHPISPSSKAHEAAIDVDPVRSNPVTQEQVEKARRDDELATQRAKEAAELAKRNAERDAEAEAALQEAYRRYSFKKDGLHPNGEKLISIASVKSVYGWPMHVPSRFYSGPGVTGSGRRGGVSTNAKVTRKQVECAEEAWEDERYMDDEDIDPLGVYTESDPYPPSLW
ncbi:hypothetical protein EIP91_007671 [Steccherinum ochraceum]|uniref:Uncharacterized protein n=1 Tax=Steccherinum ochraceum TaxID=92696 RepID=A0A4R0R3Y7_9APHY|nr:hypothetical protein EIP91_007671 [Steccherinum ochraceum]